MADSFSWFKLWMVSVTDQEMDNMDISDYGRWAKLGVFVKAHGSKGELNITEPAKGICSMLQVKDFEALHVVLKRIHGVEIKVQKCNATGKRYINVTYRNWHKWQGDMSRDRVRKHRSNVTPQSRAEQRRTRGGSNTPPLSPPKRGDVKSIKEILKNQKPILSVFLFFILTIFLICPAYSQEFTLTAYCPEKCCTGKWADGRTASGVKPLEGRTIACNWLPFGTLVEIGEITFVVEDRGAPNIFGTMSNPIRSIDIFFNNHQDAVEFGRRKALVKILED